MDGVNAQYFANTRSAFQEVHSIAGDIEPGPGLGPRFNGTSCGGCHAWPAPGGSSPKQNPQFKMAAAHGAHNRIPDFLKEDGPVLAVRVKTGVNLAGPGEVLPLFTVEGRGDAYTCVVEQPEFTDRSNLGFRIPTPLYGAGLIDNIPDAAILANRAAQAPEKLALGIGGEPNVVGSEGVVGKYGWKAQHSSLRAFAGDAYRTEMGIPNEVTGYKRESPSTVCYKLYDAAYDDPNYSVAYDSEEPSVFPFTEFMRFLRPPAPVKAYAGATSASIRAGSSLFERVGCALCHTPSLRTGNDSDLPALNGREALLYSDLLLHHMGPELADGIVQGRAGPDEFRTAPLWGIGQRVFFLHDGRTTDLLVAIRGHAGEGGGFRSEAGTVIDRFNGLSPPERQDILNFLRSL